MGYAHSDDITAESVALAASTARSISQSPNEHAPVSVQGNRGTTHNLYPVTTPPTDVPVESKIGLLNEIDAYARAKDPRVKQVMASVVCQQRHVLIVGSDGEMVGDVLPLLRLNCQVIAADGERREVGSEGMGGRYEFDQILDPTHWNSLVDEAVRTALLNLEAVACPAGSMDVVLGPGWPGILLHEAIGHGPGRDSTGPTCDQGNTDSAFSEHSLGSFQGQVRFVGAAVV